MKKICIVTATRAEYGLLKPLMIALKQDDAFHLQILVSGAHLSPEFGLTFKQIESDGFVIDEKIEMLLSADTSSSIVKSMGLGMVSYADALNRLNPDAIIILGDRYEMLAIASSSSVMKIPIIHLHGGEITEGAYDDSFRHAITKLSHLHFTSTEVYRQRVIQLGEQPNNVHNVGAIGIDNILKLPLLNKSELEKSLGIKFKKYNYQVTFHPETLSDYDSKEQFQILLDAISIQNDSYFIFTKSNADTDGRIINQMIDQFVLEHNDIASAYTSLGSLNFLSVLKNSDAIIGNSSSGIIEAPSLKIATINIGNRQKGRIQANSIINTKVNVQEIDKAIKKTQDKSFKQSLEFVKNPNGNGDTTGQIIDILKEVDFNNLLIKSFNDYK